MGLFTPIWMKPDADPVEAGKAAGRVKDQDKLKKIANEAVHDRAREVAVCRIDDERFLLDYVINRRGFSRSRKFAAGFLYSLPILFELASHDFTGDPDGAVLANEAAEKITDRGALKSLLASADSRIRQTALEKLDDPEEYAKAVNGDRNLAEWAFSHIRDADRQKELLFKLDSDLTFSRCLAKLIEGGWKPDADEVTRLMEKTEGSVFAKWGRPAVIRLLSDRDLLADIALHGGTSAVRHAAVSRLSDDKVLAAIALNGDEDIQLRMNAYEQLKDKNLVDTRTAQLLRRVEMSDEETRFADLMSEDSY